MASIRSQQFCRDYKGTSITSQLKPVYATGNCAAYLNQIDLKGCQEL